MSKLTRIEKDSLGEKTIPVEALYGIHAMRAKENFPDDTPFPLEWYKAAGTTKLACYNTYRNFRNAASKHPEKTAALRMISDDILDHLADAAKQVAAGDYFDSFIVPAVQGGAGTSINMNINEIIANAALLKSGNRPGDYKHIDPTEHANIYQSTNDVIPTALIVAVMGLLQELEDKINTLRQKIESLEIEGRNRLRPGYTQMQEAVPSSFGILFSTYNNALSRDWWRVSKCIERIKHVNLGGGATGTGMAVPRFFIMEVITELKKLTNLPLAHAENMADATANLDKWVEIHATIKAHAVNLEKLTSDIRLLASDIAGEKTITIPAKQVGSSIMPGKINPVIPEFVISSAHKVYANDMLISSLSGLGTLELNAYLPSIGCALIESLKLLIACNITLVSNLFNGISINETAGYKGVISSPSVTTALVPHIGYHKSAELAKLMKDKKVDIFEANSILQSIDIEKLRTILKPGNLLKLGFSIDDL
ncbi:MAG TPA: lyase family protein [Bacteroidales bacterium]|nr:lyase family protein [Bacteroidales bacterium]